MSRSIGLFWFFASHRGMKPPDEQHLGNDASPLKSSRLEEARRIIEEYAADLREIIKKLRKPLN
jgi:hypothetical protein